MRLKVLKEDLEAKERSIAVGIFFDDTFEKNNSTSALQHNSQKSTKKPCFFCHRNNLASNRCLEMSELSPRNLFAKRNTLCFLCLEKKHSVKSCGLAYYCHKCKGNLNITIFAPGQF